jgi:hypothetical protein
MIERQLPHHGADAQPPRGARDGRQIDAWRRDATERRVLVLDHEVGVPAGGIELLRQRDVRVIDVGHRRCGGRIATDRIPKRKIERRHDPPRILFLVSAATT